MACLLCTATVFARETFLAGSSTGLYDIDGQKPVQLWNQPNVRKIVKADKTWFFLSDGGIWSSDDLSSFEPKNDGLPVKVIKSYDNGQKTFSREAQDLKDLEVHPKNPLILVTATKDAIYLTRDGGKSWKSLGLNASTTGAKAVAVLDLPDATGTPRLTVLMSHPIYGVSYKQPDVSGAWIDLNDGLEKVPTIKWPDEVSDIAVASEGGSIAVYAAQTFMPRIYRLDWSAKKFIPIWAGADHLDSVEGLAATGSRVLFSGPGRIRELFASSTGPALMAPGGASTEVNAWNAPLAEVPGGALSAWIPPFRSGGRGALSLSELWLLTPGRRTGAYTSLANQRQGIYVPVHQAVTEAGFDGHLATIRKNGLNSLVIDMKDDYGILRYDAKDPLVLKKGRLGKGIQVEPFVAKAKQNGVYLVARIVVFKDRSLAAWGGDRYAVWDAAAQAPWKGYEIVAQKTMTSGEATAPQPSASGAPETANTTNRKYYDEAWVDPYSEEVWEYNVAIAKELIARGFDEIQFDYIRFPTDGANLGDASYRWRDAGMDKESALMSFLAYAREEIHAPISIDIYGANGWYRTGARTGQDVELLSRYVDVICPMFYPSHFEQGFLAQEPAAERPYRIYYYGTFRNTIVARNRVVVRPWAQAFYLGVSYDKTWYNEDYVRREIFGTRDSVDGGYTYWNNSGRYGDIKPNLSATDPYPWASPEAEDYETKPAYGGQ